MERSSLLLWSVTWCLLLQAADVNITCVHLNLLCSLTINKHFPDLLMCRFQSITFLQCVSGDINTSWLILNWTSQYCLWTWWCFTQRVMSSNVPPTEENIKNPTLGSWNIISRRKNRNSSCGASGKEEEATRFLHFPPLVRLKWCSFLPSECESSHFHTLKSLYGLNSFII